MEKRKKNSAAIIFARAFFRLVCVGITPRTIILLDHFLLENVHIHKMTTLREFHVFRMKGFFYVVLYGYKYYIGY